MTNKVLWIVTGEQNDLLAHAKRIEASAVAIRTDNHWLRGSIAVFLEAHSDVHDFETKHDDPGRHGAVGQMGDVMPAAAAIFWPLPVS